jgi:tetratricopeptide (TPR) repeat protein
MTETIELTDSLEAEFEKGLKRYQDGEDPASLIPFFKEIADQAPKNPTVWSCLAWLYLLTDKPEAALKAAQKSIKVDKTHPQARVNLAIAMLETKTAGVRPHVELAAQIMSFDKEIYQTVADNIEDGLTRKPDWKSLQRIKEWLLT